jgi:hypothetical protein
MKLQMGAVRGDDGFLAKAFCFVDTGIPVEGGTVRFYRERPLHANANTAVVINAIGDMAKEVAELIASQQVFSSNPAITYALALPATIE